MTAIYLHIPFCEQLCYYCDFNKVFLENQPVDDYIDAVLKEMAMMFEKYPNPKAETFYIGGGTPTALSAKQLDRLLAGIEVMVSLTECEEFTVEANPGDLTADKLRVLKDHGVNRFSMGVQTFNETLLKKIGRNHTVEDVYRSTELLHQYNFCNTTIDLMYALPGQTIDDVLDSVQRAMDLAFPHLSMYSLILENQTVFANLARKGKLMRPSEEEELEMADKARDLMYQYGLHQYEISNFSKSGYESQHNLMYWDNQHYYGFGAGASGYLANIRYRNHGPIHHYIETIQKGELPIVEQEVLSKQNQMEEHLFLGLRKRAGVTNDSFKARFDGRDLYEVYNEPIQKLVQKGWLNDNGERIWMTDAGLNFGNDVFEAFLMGE